MSEADQAGGRDQIWLETYRPQRLAEIVGQDAIVERLESYVERHDLPHMLFAGPAGIGKCVTGETPVLTTDGLARIGDVVGEIEGFDGNEARTEVLTFNGDGEFEYVEPSHVFGKTADETVSVTTRDGSDMTVTPEHRFLVLTPDGLTWREARNLASGDRVVRPLSAPLPEGEADLHWAETMDGCRTFVHLSEEFAKRHGVPFEEDLVGVKKAVVRRLRQGQDPETIADDIDAPRKTVQAAMREFRDEDLDAPSTICSLAYLRDLGLTRDDFRTHVRAIQYVTTNNRRSEPISPPCELTPQLGQFLGLAISEAAIDGGRVKFYNTDSELIERFEQLLCDLFDVDPRTGTQQGVPYVAVSNRTLTHYLESCFNVFDSAMGGDGIGSAILRADEDTRRAFLRAVFDAEGYVSPTGHIELTQKNGDHITLLSYLLASFGIPSRRTTERKAATNGSGIQRTYHKLSISSASHVRRFRETVGFTLGTKATRLETAWQRTSNSNNDTIPTQNAIGELCDRLALDKTDYIPKTLNPESPGRDRYLRGVSSLLDAATARLETIQEARETLVRLEPALTETDTVPLSWAEKRERLEPLETRAEISSRTGIREDHLLEYARGDRVPYTNRARTLLAEITDEPADPSAESTVETLQSELHQIIESVNISYERIAAETGLRGSDIANLLTQETHEIGSLPRFVTVADRLDDIFSEMSSLRTLELLNALHVLVKSSIYLDEVEKVETVTEERRVYDLTVPGTRNYVAGTIPTVMHNTTSAIAVARELYGEEWAEHFLELNASDERGIDVVRDRIKSFARTSFGGVDYRIIFLDEADALTSDAQSALRRTMEQFSNNVRFILSCNYSSQIIDPIQSRCAVFRFSPLSDEAVAEQIRHIAAQEDIEVTDDGVDALVYAADGDMRKAINGLQAAAVTGGVVDEEAVFAITSTARPEDIREMVTLALSGDFTAARSHLDDLLTEEGIAGGDVVDQLHRSVWEFDMDDDAAVRLLDRIGEADYRITEGANERIQLEALLASLALEE